MNTVTLDSALYDDVANIARWSNTSVNDIVKTGLQLLISQFEAKAKSATSDNISTEKQVAINDIHALSALEANWDGYGAVPVIKAVTDNAENIVSNKLISVKYLDDIQPNSNGTLTMTWTHGENQLCLEVGIDKISYFADINGDTFCSQVEDYSNCNILKLAAYVNQL